MGNHRNHHTATTNNAVWLSARKSDSEIEESKKIAKEERKRRVEEAKAVPTMYKAASMSKTASMAMVDSAAMVESMTRKDSRVEADSMTKHTQTMKADTMAIATKTVSTAHLKVSIDASSIQSPTSRKRKNDFKPPPQDSTKTRNEYNSFIDNALIGMERSSFEERIPIVENAMRLFSDAPFWGEKADRTPYTRDEIKKKIHQKIRLICLNKRKKIETDSSKKNQNEIPASDLIIGDVSNAGFVRLKEIVCLRGDEFHQLDVAGRKLLIDEVVEEFSGASIWKKDSTDQLYYRVHDSKHRAEISSRFRNHGHYKSALQDENGNQISFRELVLSISENDENQMIRYAENQLTVGKYDMWKGFEDIHNSRLSINICRVYWQNVMKHCVTDGKVDREALCELKSFHVSNIPFYEDVINSQEKCKEILREIPFEKLVLSTNTNISNYAAKRMNCIECCDCPNTKGRPVWFARVGNSSCKLLKLQLHIVACVAKNGPKVNKSHHASHLCGNKKCINGDHLRFESASENNDRIGCVGFLEDESGRLYKNPECSHYPPCYTIGKGIMF